MSFKTKSDIPFLRFLEFSEIVENETDNTFIANKILEMFYNKPKFFKAKKITNFLKAIETNGKLKMRYKINPEALGLTDTFIDFENLSSDNDFEGLLKLLVKPKYFWQKVDVNKISITEGEFILGFFLKSAKK